MKDNPKLARIHNQSFRNRSNTKNLPFTVIQLDVKEDRSAENAFGKLAIENKRIDVILNNNCHWLFSPMENLTRSVYDKGMDY